MIKIDVYYNAKGSCMVSCKAKGLRKKSYPYDYYYGNRDNARLAMIAYCEMHGLPSHSLQDNTKTGIYTALIS